MLRDVAGIAIHEGDHGRRVVFVNLSQGLLRYRVHLILIIDF